MFDAPLTPMSESGAEHYSHQRSKGEGRLWVKSRDERTHIDNLFQEGCAKIRVPSRRGAGLEAVMINSSGGMTGGDRLSWHFGAAPDTALTVTTQACERVYAATTDRACSDIKLSLGQRSKIAWLPQETIMFDQGAFNRSLDVDMAEDAELFIVEPIIFGRKSMGEAIQNGVFQDQWRIRKNGILCHAEQSLLTGAIEAKLQRSAACNSQIAMATLLLIAPHAEAMLPKALDIIGLNGSASFWQGKLVARVLAADAYHLRHILCPLIQTLNRGTPVPKIWNL